jgi:hypothetical protein
MDDQLSLPLTIKARFGSLRDTLLPRKRSPLTNRLDPRISQSRFSPSPPWQDAQVKPYRTKEIKNETAIKHMHHADSWFSVVRAHHPGRTYSIEE